MDLSSVPKTKQLMASSSAMDFFRVFKHVITVCRLRGVFLYTSKNCDISPGSNVSIGVTNSILVALMPEVSLLHLKLNMFLKKIHQYLEPGPYFFGCEFHTLANPMLDFSERKYTREKISHNSLGGVKKEELEDH
ncbi:hypothetical protein MAR_001316 [Mya arenaria]|uniref:Uncharacterized protein n=1 Tax=Mya arenaria TaxID=6604 RepID=A0ABY7FFH9_MYAAR|nr:hypothetical protein MAR_001316 [Mya arenaria]